MLMVKSVTSNLSPMIPQYPLSTLARITLHCDPGTCLYIFSDYIPGVSSTGNAFSSRLSKSHPLAQFNYHNLMNFSTIPSN